MHRMGDIPGIRVGHWTDSEGCTGCTVILLPPGTTGGCDVRGSAPATRDTRLLECSARIEEIHGLVFTGGSAYGLDAAGGVMRFLEEQGIGHVTSAGVVPIVPAAAIFDLNRGKASTRPGTNEGEAAARSAAETFAAGNVGAGAGASCGKWKGVEHAVPAGLGISSMRRGDLTVGALAVVNPVGDIIDEKGNVILGHGAAGTVVPDAGDDNTVLVAVASNCRLDKPGCIQAAARIHDGIARSVYPARTKHDGDAGFFLSCGSLEVDLDAVFVLTAEATASAVRSVATRRPRTR
jgi:L-aminopeptidase/D-esterase-like protein